ncbi:MAG TPA: hypothetical protein VFZ58_02400 [Candidatus Saccharimonadales bacterium]
MTRSSPEETNNPNKRLNDEQYDFEKTIRFFSQPEQREALAQFELTKKEDGMVFATPEGSFGYVSYPLEDPEDKGRLNYIFSYEKMQKDGTRSLLSREISLPKGFVPGETEQEGGGTRWVIFDLSVIIDVAPEAKPETVNWLVDTFGGHTLTVEHDASNAITRLENETGTIGFDSENVIHIADFYQQGVEHNKEVNPKVAAEEVERKITAQNDFILDSIFIAGATGKAKKARRLLNRFLRRTDAQRKRETAQHLGWLNEADLEPPIPKVRNYRR